MKYYAGVVSACCALFVQACDDAPLERALMQLVGEPVQYEVAYYDLNRNGVKDAIVYVNDVAYCGSGGCTTLIFEGSAKGFTFVNRVTVSKKPMWVAETYTHGWADIMLTTRGKGLVLLSFNGQTYPLNPSLQNTVSDTEQANAQLLSFKKKGKA